MRHLSEMAIIPAMWVHVLLSVSALAILRQPSDGAKTPGSRTILPEHLPRLLDERKTRAISGEGA
jgi:hypothetical protein